MGDMIDPSGFNRVYGKCSLNWNMRLMGENDCRMGKSRGGRTPQRATVYPRLDGEDQLRKGALRREVQRGDGRVLGKVPKRGKGGGHRRVGEALQNQHKKNVRRIQLAVQDQKVGEAVKHYVSNQPETTKIGPSTAACSRTRRPGDPRAVAEVRTKNPQALTKVKDC